MNHKLTNRYGPKEKCQKKKKKTYTKTPVTMEARKVPNIANVTIAPKLEKKGFCKEQKRKVKRPISNERMQQE